MTLLNFVRIVFRNFVLLNAPELFFTHFHKQNQIQLSLYWVCGELYLTYTKYKLNLQ